MAGTIRECRKAEHMDDARNKYAALQLHLEGEKATQRAGSPNNLDLFRLTDDELGLAALWLEDPHIRKNIMLRQEEVDSAPYADIKEAIEEQTEQLKPLVPALPWWAMLVGKNKSAFLGAGIGAVDIEAPSPWPAILFLVVLVVESPRVSVCLHRCTLVKKSGLLWRQADQAFLTWTISVAQATS